MASVSVLLCTARDDYPIIGLPDMHVFYPTFNALLQQTFTDFEVIVVDALYPKRREWLDRKWGFPVKYVPVHPNHRFWFDRKRWSICASLNTAILHAEGELLVRIDDCSEFDPLFLQMFWDGYRSGYFPLAMHTRFRDGKQEYYNEVSRQGSVRDTRYPVVKSSGGRMVAPYHAYYGYSSLSLEAALKVNGFNELFDGDRGQEDQEMGLRLYMAGYKDMFILDVNHQLIEHEHMPIPPDVVIPNQGNIKSNYALFLLSKNKNRWIANSQKLTEDEVEFVRQESLKPPSSPKPNCYEDDCRGPLFDLWLSGQNVFDLREERLSL